MKTPAISLAAVLCLTASAAASTFTVDNIFDPGSGTCDALGCTLHEAIDAANANPGADTIAFDIPQAGVNLITLITDLPPITDPVTIDGYTQPGASANTLAVGDNAVLLIELSGDNTFAGLVVLASDCAIRGLVITRCFDVGIFISGQLSNVAIDGNFVGTSAAGTVDLGNGGVGVAINAASNNVIGGTTPAKRNLISGNGSAGVWIFGGDGSGNVVQGNYIGTDSSGSTALGNDDDGVRISLDSSDNLVGGVVPGAGNLIAGNARHGVYITDSGGGGTGGSNTVQGNLVGADASGTLSLPNDGSGVFIEGENDNFIGGTDAGAGNLISGNGGDGVLIAANAAGNTVQGNFIGTDLTGTVVLSNFANGVDIIDSPNNVIGGAIPGAGNLISGNSFGVQIAGAGAIGNIVQGNLIGTDVSGTQPLGNSATGVVLSDATDATVGGPGDAGNTIAFNTAYGIFVDSLSVGISIFGNSILANGLVGINLAGGTEVGNAVTANDFPDSDTGANNLQNYPVINNIAVSRSDRTVEGELASNPNTSYVLDFYSNTEVDASGYGEGKTYLGFLDVQTNAQGVVDFTFPLDASSLGQFITATATDPAGNTSEFSMASAVVPSISRFLNISTRLRVQTGDNVLIGGFIITGNDSKQVLVRAIGPSLGGLGVQGFLANPILELHYPDGTVVTNDDWRDTQEAEIIATGLAPNDDLESAVVATLDPGLYTAIVSGVSGGTGIGLVEAYDLGQTADSTLANISTRGLVETGDNILIGGIIIGPDEAADGSVLIRALGSSLTDLGVPNALADPTLELHDGNGSLITSNNDWKSTQQAAIEATGIPPTNDKEAAILATLVPGNYTAIMQGAGNTTGVGLVEAYHLD